MKVGIELICSNCGAHLEKDDKFCVNCGQSVFDNPKTKTEHNFNSQDRQCPKCHKVVNAIATILLKLAIIFNGLFANVIPLTRRNMPLERELDKYLK